MSKFVGPAHGMEFDCSVMNKGKTNKVGKHEYTAIAPHVNPILDTIALQGLCYLVQHLIMGEPIHNFLNVEDYMLMPVYRSARSRVLSSLTQQEQWHRFYASQGIVINTVTHQG